MWKHMLVLFMLTAFGATSLAIAQTGGDFSLTWSSLNSGGQLSSGGDFTLNSSIGQPGAGMISGGTFDINAGFQQCFTESPALLSTNHNDTSIAIDWTGNNANIYRASDAPYFTPVAPFASDVTPNWKDGGALTANENYTYLIRNLNECGESADSARIGVFHFGLQPGN